LEKVDTGYTFFVVFKGTSLQSIKTQKFRNDDDLEHFFER